MNTTADTPKCSGYHCLQSKAYAVSDKVKCANSPVGEYGIELPQTNFALHPVSFCTGCKLFRATSPGPMLAAPSAVRFLQLQLYSLTGPIYRS